MDRVQTDSDKESALVLQCALEASVQLEAFPKSVVDIYCLVLESGGSDMGLLVTAASLALADAGIPLFDLVAACNIVRRFDPHDLQSQPGFPSCNAALELRHFL